jgi:O-acetyl-ADP-ribose deacetylase (regulator of RNase III)
VETWSEEFGKFNVECVGIPPFPGNSYPRVVGIATLATKEEKKKVPSINYVKGDASVPRGKGSKIIAHVVNDTARKWGGRGFAKHVSKKWPEVYKDFIHWCKEDLYNFDLGNAHLYEHSDNLYVYSMVCQHGYGKSVKPRIRYNALRKSLYQLYDVATDFSASVHMPRIGCGHAGGDWFIVSEIIEEILINKGVKVTIYDLPT